LDWKEAEPFLTEVMKMTINKIRKDNFENKRPKDLDQEKLKRLEWADEREKNLSKYVKELFNNLDQDGDGTLYMYEFDSLFHSFKSKINFPN
jgi:Ca2+-binding EF-hand superfamily protein